MELPLDLLLLKIYSGKGQNFDQTQFEECPDLFTLNSGTRKISLRSLESRRLLALMNVQTHDYKNSDYAMMFTELLFTNRRCINMLHAT